MPRPEHVDLAHLLLRKAEGDLAVARLIAADPTRTTTRSAFTPSKPSTAIDWAQTLLRRAASGDD